MSSTTETTNCQHPLLDYIEGTIELKFLGYSNNENRNYACICRICEKENLLLPHNFTKCSACNQIFCGECCKTLKVNEVYKKAYTSSDNSKSIMKIYRSITINEILSDNMYEIREVEPEHHFITDANGILVNREINLLRPFIQFYKNKEEQCPCYKTKVETDVNDYEECFCIVDCNKCNIYKDLNLPLNHCITDWENLDEYPKNLFRLRDKRGRLLDNLELCFSDEFDRISEPYYQILKATCLSDLPVIQSLKYRIGKPFVIDPVVKRRNGVLTNWGTFKLGGVGIYSLAFYMSCQFKHAMDYWGYGLVTDVEPPEWSEGDDDAIDIEELEKDDV